MKTLKGLILALLWATPSWALTFVGTSAIDASSDLSSNTTTTCSKPSGTADNDIMFAIVKRLTANSWSTVPTGWSLAATDDDAGSTTSHDLYYRVASSEGTSYSWIQSGASRTGCSIYTWRDDFDTADPIDVVSNTSYETNDTNVRGASMTTSAANEVLLFFGLSHASSSQTFSPATVPATFSENADGGSTDSRFFRTAASVVWSGSGATGTMDATLSASNQSKHAFVVALNPASAGAAPNFYFRLRVNP